MKPTDPAWLAMNADERFEHICAEEAAKRARRSAGAKARWAKYNELKRAFIKRDPTKDVRDLI